LTYANVVATLALFVALGGSSYAISQIGSRQVKDRSLRGRDLHRDTVTGKEVRESSLGTVPSAQSAATASIATAASQAANADQLGGQGPAAFEKSSRIQFGRAPSSPPDIASENTLVEWPRLGVQIKTAANNGGCSVGKLGLRFVNTKTSGPFMRIYDPTIAANLPPDTSFVVCSPVDNELRGAAGDTTGPTLFFDCLGVEGQASCIGIRSEP
jgi:hypothetical protein